MNKTIFDILSLDRNLVHWEDYLYKHTPCELVVNPETNQQVWFKREDYFAPLSNYVNGQQGINGSKLRQAIWLMVARSPLWRQQSLDTSVVRQPLYSERPNPPPV